MNSYSLSEYARVGCMQIEPGPGFYLGVSLYGFTAGRMCPGCPKFSNGKGGCYRKLTSAGNQKVTTTAPVETVRQEATRRGLSISEVRRQRAKEAQS